MFLWLSFVTPQSIWSRKGFLIELVMVRVRVGEYDKCNSTLCLEMTLLFIVIPNGISCSWTGGPTHWESFVSFCIICPKFLPRVRLSVLRIYLSVSCVLLSVSRVWKKICEYWPTCRDLNRLVGWFFITRAG